MRHNQSRIGKGRLADPKGAAAEAPSTRAEHQSVPRRESPRARRLPMVKDPSVRGSRNTKQTKSSGQKVITHEALDERLDVLALSPDSFAAGCLTLADELDRTGTG